MMASRPLVRGSNDSDVLSSFVEEEIVVGSVGDSSDIYGGQVADSEPEVVESPTEQMIVDHGAQRKAPVNGVTSRKVGGDILGLADEDDMGEKHLIIRRGEVSQEQPLIQVETRKPEPIPEPAQAFEPLALDADNDCLLYTSDAADD